VQILIDADGCPVVDLAVELARQQRIPCVILCDTAHRIEKPGAETVVLSKGTDSVDFALVNRVRRGDIVVTQDYGLAAMCLAKGGIPISQNGLEYSGDNIDGLLYARHAAKKIRSAGGRLKGPAKRTKDQDKAFENKLRSLMEKG
jgi:hypothetical protein